MAFMIKAVDPVSRQIGLRLSLRQGNLDLRADRMTLAEAAEARLLVRF